MQKIVNSDDYPEMHELNSDWARWYSIGFAYMNGNDAIISGSGTLVSAGNKYAILTADHVIENIKRNRKNKIGIIFLSSKNNQFINYSLKLEHIDCVTIGEASNSSKGPDLGYFRLLSDQDIEFLKIRNNFYNLGKKREKVLTAPPSIQTPG